MAPPGRQRRPAGSQAADVVDTHDDMLTIPPSTDIGGSAALFPVEHNAYGLHIPPIEERAARDVLRGLEAARDRRYAGTQLVESVTDTQGIAVVDQAIRAFGEMHGEVDANDIRPLLPRERASLVGSRFLALAKQGRLVKIGYVQANHAAGRGRMIARWRWVD